MDDKNSKKVIDVAEVVLASAGAAIGGPAGTVLSVTSVVASKLHFTLQRRWAAKESRFLERVCFYLEENDPDDAAAFVADNVENDGFADVLMRAFERMMKAYNPLAEECICMLTADYLRQDEPIIRDFAAAGDLLIASDTDTLSTLNNITSAYVELYSASKCVAKKGILWDSAGIPGESGPFFFITDRAQDTAVSSSRFYSPANLRRVLILMENHGFGSAPQGLVETPPARMNQGGPQCEYYFAPEDDTPMKRLHSCLAPVRRIKEA